jgi:hypothetical protein
MQIRHSVLEKMKWEYATRDDGTKLRFAIHDNQLIAQKRTIFPENSKRRLMQKAMRGEYSLTNLEIKGTGNSYLIIGWEETEMFSDILIPQAA